MKTYSKIIAALGFVVLVGLVFSPIVSAKADFFGQNKQENGQDKIGGRGTGSPSATPSHSDKPSNKKGGINFCANVDKMTQLETKMIDNEDKIEQKREEQKKKIDDRWVERNTKRENNRNKWDENRDEFFAKLEGKATTDAQKQALLAFKEATTAAITARRATIDSAIEAFRKGVEQAIASKKTSVDTLVSAFRAEIQAAITKAKADCALTNPDAVAIRVAFQNRVKAAKEKFITDKKDVDKISDSLQSLIDAKKQAVEKANSDFKAAIEKARNDLKAVFPVPTVTPSPTATPTTNP
jgi:hypothetical protein